MAKKVVATLKTDSGKGYAKIIRMVKTAKTGAYTFSEEIIASEKVKEHFSNKK
ncbi:MAG TPA: DUF4295 domain-containing protein [Bacteroidales bacterium]|nr:DUF4295 domain-containing protein [Bacteroidales bacterium]